MIEAPDDDDATYSGEEVVSAVNTSIGTCILIAEREAKKQEDMGFRFEATAIRKLVPLFEKLRS